MENKINIAELLKDCPRGMELYSPIFGKVYLDKIRPHLGIVVTTGKEQGDFKEEFLYDGRYGMNGECMLFPSKDKTTWEGFVPPFKFKDGDILFVKARYDWIFIYKENEDQEDLYKYAAIPTYSDRANQLVYDSIPLCCKKDVTEIRLATKEEKEKLFKAMKDRGHKWNPETKTLEELVVPQFKVGDKITNGKASITIGYIDDEYYYEIGRNVSNRLFIKNQDEWNLVPNKFDISTLKPFDKVLVRGDVGQKWIHDFFGFMDKDKGFPFVCVGHYVIQCIPYKGNEHLLGTNNDCDEYFKTWK